MMQVSGTATLATIPATRTDPAKNADVRRSAPCAAVPRRPTPSERNALVEVLTDALDHDELPRLAAFAFGIPLAQIASPLLETPAIVLKLVDWADAHDQFVALVDSAKSLVPENPGLHDWLCQPRDPRDPPYLGLQAFRETDAEIFFGRDAAAERLVEAVARRSLVAVIGPSGSGKSSLVFAGMVPRLRRAGGWVIASFRPTADPFAALANALFPILETPDPEATETHLLRARTELAANLRDGEISCTAVLQRIREKHQPSRRLLLVADQFEELFTLVPDDAARRRFLDTLLAAFPRATERGTESPPLVLVPTLRADFLDQALSYPPLVDALQGSDLKLGPMNREELRQAIERPAALRGVALEFGLAARILDDVDAEPGSLPLLQFALRRLWEERKADLLTHATYSEIGELEGALTNYAEGVIADLGGESELIRQVFTQMVRPGEGVVDTRRRATRAELGIAGWGLAGRLATAKLVVTDYDPLLSTPTAEVAHEALIQKWPRLHEWMNHDRDFRRWQERLRGSVADWQEAGRDTGALLRGDFLTVAEDWRRQRGPQLSDMELRFIDESAVARNRDIAWQRLVRIGLCTLTALAFALAVFAMMQRSDAQHQARISLIQALSAAAVNQIVPGEHELGALLARQAFVLDEQAGRANRRQVDDALRQVLRLPRFNRVLQAHEHPIRSVVAAPTGTQLASADDGGVILLWDVNQPTMPPRPLDQLATPIYALAYAPTGDRLAAAGNDGTIRVWDLKQSGTEPRVQRTGTSSLLAMAFSPADGHLAVGDADGAIFLWNVDQANAKAEHVGDHDGAVRALAFSSHDGRLASAGENGTVRLWRTDHRGGASATFQVDDLPIRSIAFAPNGRQFAAGSADGRIRLWDPDRPAAAMATLEGHQRAVRAVAYAPGGKSLASAGEDGSVRLWNLDALDADPRVLNQELPLANEEVFTPGTPLPAIWSLAFAPGDAGRLLASAGDDRMIRLWDVADPGATPRVLQEDAGAVPAVAYGPDSQLVTGSSRGAVERWDPVHPSQGPTMVADDVGEIWCVAVSPSANWLAAGTNAGNVLLWNLRQTGTEPQRLSGRTLLARSLAFSPAGDWLATGSTDGSVRIWRLGSSGAELQTLASSIQHSGRVWAVAFSPVDNRLVSAGEDGTILLWNLDQPRAPATKLGRHSESIQAIAFSPTGGQVVSAGFDGSITFWDPQRAGTSTRTIPGNASAVKAIAFSPNGDWLATGSADGTLRILEPQHPENDPIVLGRIAGEVWSVAFSPNGQTLASGGRTPGARLWLVETSSLAELVCQRVWRNLNEDEWQRFGGPRLPGEPTCPETAVH